MLHTPGATFHDARSVLNHPRSILRDLRSILNDPRLMIYASSLTYHNAIRRCHFFIHQLTHVRLQNDDRPDSPAYTLSSFNSDKTCPHTQNMSPHTEYMSPHRKHKFQSHSQSRCDTNDRGLSTLAVYIINLVGSTLFHDMKKRVM